MKKKQIPFDFSKWGQEGISVMLGSINMITLHKHPKTENRYYGLDIDCEFWVSSENEFRMYQEIKPREIWVNEYPRHFGSTYNTKEEAEKCKAGSCIRTIKFREVLDDEQ